MALSKFQILSHGWPDGQWSIAGSDHDDLLKIRSANGTSTPPDSEIEDHRITAESELLVEGGMTAGEARSTKRSAMREEWDFLPAWIRGPYRPLFDAANQLLDEQDDEAALEMISSAEANASIKEDLTSYVELGDRTKAEYFSLVKANFIALVKSLTNP